MTGINTHATKTTKETVIETTDATVIKTTDANAIKTIDATAIKTTDDAAWTVSDEAAGRRSRRDDQDTTGTGKNAKCDLECFSSEFTFFMSFYIVSL